MILLFEEYQYTNADDIVLIKQCVDQAYLTELSFNVFILSEIETIPSFSPLPYIGSLW